VATETTYPYPEDTGRTHWEGCWRERGHHNCAVAEVERLAADPLRAMLAEVVEMIQTFPFRAYTEAQSEGLDAHGAWGSFVDEASDYLDDIEARLRTATEGGTDNEG
jgi:hypothetical protein